MKGEAILRPVVSVRVFAQDEQDRILLLKRDNTEHSKGEWCLPGGKMDYCSSPEETVITEMKEETGLDAGAPRFLFYQNSLPLRPGRMHCLNLYFSCHCAGEVTINTESTDYAWVEPQNAAAYRLAFGGDQALRRWLEMR